MAETTSLAPVMDCLVFVVLIRPARAATADSWTTLGRLPSPSTRTRHRIGGAQIGFGNCLGARDPLRVSRVVTREVRGGEDGLSFSDSLPSSVPASVRGGDRCGSHGPDHEANARKDLPPTFPPSCIPPCRVTFRGSYPNDAAALHLISSTKVPTTPSPFDGQFNVRHARLRARRLGAAETTHILRLCGALQPTPPGATLFPRPHAEDHLQDDVRYLLDPDKPEHVVSGAFAASSSSRGVACRHRRQG